MYARGRGRFDGQLRREHARSGLGNYLRERRAKITGDDGPLTPQEDAIRSAMLEIEGIKDAVRALWSEPPRAEEVWRQLLDSITGAVRDMRVALICGPHDGPHARLLDHLRGVQCGFAKLVPDVRLGYVPDDRLEWLALLLVKEYPYAHDPVYMANLRLKVQAEEN